MSAYLVTGAAGFIGAKVSEMLLEDEHTVVGVDNLNDAYDVRMKKYRLNKLKGFIRFKFIKRDISKKSIIEHLEGGGFDAIIHLAARAGVRYSVENPWEFLNSNVTGTLNMLELCRQTGTKKFILASTSSVYGAKPPLPTSETDSSDMPIQPYAASKKAAEALAHAYHHLYDIDVSVLRYFTVYGPAGRPDLALFRFVKWICDGQAVQVNGNGEHSRGFTYVGDIASGTIAALKPVGFEIFNLGGDEVVTINELIELIKMVTGKGAEVHYNPPNPGDVLTSHANTSKALNMLRWGPRYSLREGVEETVRWYADERDWASEIEL